MTPRCGFIQPSRVDETKSKNLLRNTMEKKI
jgi:hypothetical protein